jgi:PAS domain-containing protein
VVAVLRKGELPRRTVSREKVLTQFNAMFLEIAGYTGKEVRGLGNLSELTSDKMQALLHRKTLEALAIFVRRRRPRIRLLSERGSQEPNAI